MKQLFIADLHLSPDHPRLVRGFLDLLRHYQGQVDQLYILGDWFEAWIGDDDHSAWLDDIVKALQQFVAHGTQVFFMHGNRDFALGQSFMQRFGGTLISDDTLSIVHPQLKISVEHGDALCTDDTDYQRFRSIIRSKFVLTPLLKTPLILRRAIANYARQKSKQSHQLKASYIMDVNAEAVKNRLTEHDVLLHGHTHRPALHSHDDGKKRYVLGDWRDDKTNDCGEAVIALFDEEHGLQLIDWKF